MMKAAHNPSIGHLESSDDESGSLEEEGDKPNEYEDKTKHSEGLLPTQE